MSDPPGQLGRLLAIIGGVLLLTGLALALAPRIPFVGKLPGDFQWNVGQTTVSVPLATSILVSLILTIIVNIIIRISR
jgi:hypothetical protein